MELSNDNLVGFGRPLSDNAIYALIIDVMVAPNQRNKGVADSIVKWMLKDLDELFDSVMLFMEFFKFFDRLGLLKDEIFNLREPLTELKILKQVFSWYKEEAEFDDESKDVFCPVKKRHYALGSIKKKVKRDKKIPPSDVLASL